MTTSADARRYRAARIAHDSEVRGLLRRRTEDETRDEIVDRLRPLGLSDAAIAAALDAWRADRLAARRGCDLAEVCGQAIALLALATVNADSDDDALPFWQAAKQIEAAATAAADDVIG